MRAAWPTISSIGKIVGRAYTHPALRATLSQGERDLAFKKNLKDL